MLVICEDCAKKYNIDENKIKGESARFSCQECGHIIVVRKPDPAAHPVGDAKNGSDTPKNSQEKSTASTTAAQTQSAAPTGKGMPISAYLFLTLVAGFLTISGMFAFLYLQYIPGIINQQVELRTKAIATSFAGVIQKPLLVRNYLQVNKEAQRTSSLPGVAYAAVVNKRGIVIAGFFNDLDRFNKDFVMEVKRRGFPKSVVAANKLTAGMAEKSSRIEVGGQPIYDQVIALPNNVGEVHIGVYVTDIAKTIKDIMLSPLTMYRVGGVLLLGFVIFLLLNRAISKPTKELTEVANRISLGEMDLTIIPKGSREMRELAIAFERMRFSVKAAMDRLRR
jgi:HAMP domain-containing protein/DNA-directed RNA polymerase subunit RPC12/RpoP